MDIPINVLMIEDNPGDARLARECFKEFKIANQLRIVADGREALQYLRQEDGYGALELPDVIFLNVKAVGYKGHNPLWQHLQADVRLRDIPLVILIASDSEADGLDGQRTSCLCLFKPFSIDHLLNIVHHVNEYGIVIAKQPAP